MAGPVGCSGWFATLLCPLLNNQDGSRARLACELGRAVLAEAAVADGQRIALELVDPLEGRPLGRTVLIGEVEVRRALARVELHGTRAALLILVQEGRLVALDRQEAILDLVLVLPINRYGRSCPFALELLQLLVVRAFFLGRGGVQETDPSRRQKHH